MPKGLARDSLNSVPIHRSGRRASPDGQAEPGLVLTRWRREDGEVTIRDSIRAREDQTELGRRA